jgi:hypothetical protein
VALADQALYAAKHQGRDRYVLADQDSAKQDAGSTTVLPLRTAERFREASGA